MPTKAWRQIQADDALLDVLRSGGTPPREAGVLGGFLLYWQAQERGRHACGETGSGTGSPAGTPLSPGPLGEPSQWIT